MEQEGVIASMLNKAAKCGISDPNLKDVIQDYFTGR
jgi:hypothetical protein